MKHNHLLSIFQIIFVVQLFFLCGCTEEAFDSSTSADRNRLSEYRDHETNVETEPANLREIVLGERYQNPYDIDVMSEAYDLLVSNNAFQNARNVPDVPFVNSVYYRVLPDNQEELEYLMSEPFADYSSIPYDYEIIENGNYYIDPDCSESTWLYAIVSSETGLPEYGEVELLNELYIPEEKEYVEEWDIDGVGMLEYLAYKLTYNLSEWEEEDIIDYETLLSEYGLDGVGEYGFAYCSPTCLKAPARRSSCKAYPSGRFAMEKDGQEDGLCGAQVVIHNIVKCYKGIIDKDGFYTSSTVFRTKVWYQIRFFNMLTNCSIFPTFPIEGAARMRLGQFPKEGYDYVITPDGLGGDEEHKHDKEYWRYAFINNTLCKNHEYNLTYNIHEPLNMRIWVFPAMEQWTGSTPMLHLSGGGWSFLLDNLLLVFGVPFFNLLVPDMCLFVKNDPTEIEDPKDLAETIHHEMAHAGHYCKVGNNYWDNYISHIITHAGYGDSCTSGSNAGYCGIGEMWGTYLGRFYTAKQYGSPDLSNINKISGYWFNPNIMIEIGNKAHARGISPKILFNALNSNVHSLESLQNSLVRAGIPEDIVKQAIKSEGGWQ